MNLADVAIGFGIGMLAGSFGMFLINAGWSRYSQKQNREWAEFCEEQNNSWFKMSAALIGPAPSPSNTRQESTDG